MEGLISGPSRLFFFKKNWSSSVFLAALFHVLICISLSKFLSGFSRYKTLQTSSCIIRTADHCQRKCPHHFRSYFEDDFSLMGGFLRKLLVSLPTEYHGEVCFPIDLCGKTRPDTRPPVADGWAGAEIGVFTTRSLPTDQRTDRDSYRVACPQPQRNK